MMHDYQRKGYSSRGAWMGRASDLPFDATGPLTVRKVPIDEGGYDPGGAYWGSPDDLYLVSDEDGRTHYHRAANVGAVRALFAQATWAPLDATLGDGDLDEMVDGYVRCAFWSSMDESDDSGGKPLDEDYDADDDLASETRARMRADCERFAKDNLASILACLSSDEHALDWSRVGHDLWLTRNGHGAGFWDGDYPEPHAEHLSDAARKMHSFDLYVGDDGKVYGS